MSTTYTRMMLTALMMVFTLSSPASSASPRAVAAKCKPYKIPVEIDSPNHRYKPYSVELYRCLGECSHASPVNCECVAATQQDSKFRIIAGFSGFQEQILQNHTSCKNRCRASIKNMCQSGGHQWSEQTCTCGCPTAPTANPCNADQRWESGKCQCVCNTQSQACSKGMKWNSSLCKCQCTLETHTQCSKLGKVTNLKTCTCENTQAVITGQVVGKKLSGNETKLVAALVVIGFLLGTLFIIDLVLMCSKKGFIYGLFTKCSKKDDTSLTSRREAAETGSIMLENDSSFQDTERNGHCRHNQPLNSEPTTVV